ncbi:conserved membrane hypothetical protein [Tenacibaculum maritimum]|uniref:DUF6787 family protein n=1 Tax=Tenacibaculum maritimum TaxID=107401 RepID=UPI0012E5FBFF|nr:conserved membrane hypothetical protein [Tenacibaculum maritimum]CAA0202723.1 conserved membrane hypothetical protein [Tenacibaculum maritimum]
MIQKLKKKWGITSNFQLLIILLVFSINGSLSVWLAKPILQFLGINATHLNPILFLTLRILVMFVLYQLLLVIIGTLFGQYFFFWSMEKRMLNRLGIMGFLKKMKQVIQSS